ncbi:MAG: hypothetical protein M0Z56_08800 [Desulfobacteraceae bacterium]|nr:hypothetical protein [Desulfobacteraceae bacterium]
MKSRVKLFAVILCVLLVNLWLFSCSEKKKEGKVIVTEKEFTLEKDGKVAFSLDVNGKVKNVGDVDVKNVVVTGRCSACDEVMISGKWFVTQIEKTPQQKDTISYLPKGAEMKYKFKGIAFYYTKAGETPKTNPEGLDVYIESFETAGK